MFKLGLFPKIRRHGYNIIQVPYDNSWELKKKGTKL